MRPPRRARYQTGSVYERCGSFFVRYYTTAVVDGVSKRTQHSEWLCDKDEKYYSKNCKAVNLERDKFMIRINSDPHPQHDVAITKFWEKTYLPFITENLRASTVLGYKQIWKSQLNAHFEGKTLQAYKTFHGSEFLTRLAKTYCRSTLAHFRSLASGIFTHAVNTGLLDTNPWHDVKILGKVKAPGNTSHYTLEEVENIVSALVERVDCQLIIVLSYFVGLRTSEIAALRWEDFDGKQVHIRRACVRGTVDDLKTIHSNAYLPLLPQVLIPLELWRQKSGSPNQGWLFPNRFAKPTDLRDLARRVIKPVLKREKLEWKGFYAGRRGAGTILVELTGNLVAAQELLRHKSLTTTAMFYKKRTQNALSSGLKLLEEAASKQRL